MHHIDFWFDVISPYAHLAFHRLPTELKGLSYSVRYRPALFAGLLKHHGQLGPAEIPAKKLWTFRQVNWLAQHHGIALQAPSTHPFNPLAILRLLLQAGPGDGSCNRHQAEQALAHVWQSGGQDACADNRIQTLAAGLLNNDHVAPSAKAQLLANGEEAIRLGIFGVPSFVCQGQVFWGADALPMLKEFLHGSPWFSSTCWTQAAPSDGVQRRAAVANMPSQGIPT